MKQSTDKAPSNPTKQFVVSILPRDISLDGASGSQVAKWKAGSSI